VNARLTSSGKIVCGLACSATIGRVIEVDGWFLAVALPAGWLPDERNVWRPTPHAARHKARHGTYKRRRRPSFSPPMGPDCEEFVVVWPLPAGTVCPACRYPQILDAQALAVSTDVYLVGMRPDTPHILWVRRDQPNIALSPAGDLRAKL
jgi:hypothetical protein